MKLAYLSTYDVRDVKLFSGLGYYTSKALENQSLEIEYIHNLKEKYSLFFKTKKAYYKILLQSRYFADREPLVLKSYAKQASKQISKLDVDLIFSPGTVPISNLDCDKPIVFWTDATFAGMIDFYPIFSNLCKETIRHGNAMEKVALQKCDLAIYASEWAAKTAINYYHAEPEKVKVVPFGANIYCDRTFLEINDIVTARPQNKCQLLFIGTEWYRKGADKAIEVAQELNKLCLKTELIMVGCQPPSTDNFPDFVKFIGYLDKSIAADLNLINQIFAQSHFLILPSLAEAYGHVFCEASSFGVPSLTTNVGGIPTAVRDGINGKTFSRSASAEEYSNYVFDLFSNYSEYQKLALSSFEEYESRLNWSVAGKSVKQLLRDIL